MEDDDSTKTPVSINTGCENENKEKLSNVDAHPGDIMDEQNDVGNEKLCQTENFIELDKELEDGQSSLQVNFQLTETVLVSEEQKCSNSGAITENGCQAPRDGSPSRSSYRICILH